MKPFSKISTYFFSQRFFFQTQLLLKKRIENEKLPSYRSNTTHLILLVVALVYHIKAGLFKIKFTNLTQTCDPQLHY